MAGARIEWDHAEASAALGTAVERLDNPAPLFQSIIEYLTRIHRARFRAQTAPDGTPWAPLSPAYQRRKHKNRNRILTLRGYLSGTLRGQYDDTGLEFGTDRPYGAAHQFGAEIQRAASVRELYFRRTRNGEIGNRFVKRGKSNFAQLVKVKAHMIRIPARPWLGTNDDQDNHILEITQDYLANTPTR
ncbi:phage virion morphogenesis protein [Alloalcanivorax xenomutans]